MLRRALLLAAAALAVAGCNSGDHAKTAAAGPSGGKSAARSPVPAPPPRKVRGPHDKPVPILMYHVISAPKPGAPYPELYTPGPVFSAQMHALARRGYHGITMEQLYRYWHLGYALPRKPIVVSFDDGYLSDATHAMPVLRSVRWPGVLNLEVNNIRGGDLTRHQVEQLLAAGWEVDSHTLTHPDLTRVSAAQLRSELVGSRARLRKLFGVPVDFFCYPAGRFDSTVVAAVRAAGYKLATTTQPTLARPSAPYTLGRIRVDGQDGVPGLLAKLSNPGTAQGGPAGG